MHGTVYQSSLMAAGASNPGNEPFDHPDQAQKFQVGFVDLRSRIANNFLYYDEQWTGPIVRVIAPQLPLGLNWSPNELHLLATEAWEVLQRRGEKGPWIDVTLFRSKRDAFTGGTSNPEPYYQFKSPAGRFVWKVGALSGSVIGVDTTAADAERILGASVSNESVGEVRV